MSQSAIKYVRGLGLLLLLLLVLGFAGLSAGVVVMEYGLYAYDDDLVAGGHALSASKHGEAHNRLRNLRWDLSNCEDTFRGSQPGADAQGLPLHGWMARALIFSWQGGASRFIDYEKPWNDPANKEAFARRIQTYESPFRSLPRHNADGYALAHIAGNSHIFDPGGHKLNAPILDGQSQTILAGDAAGNYQPWGKPRTDRDPNLGINKSKDGFGGPWASGGAMMVFADGSVRMMSKDTSPEVLRALANPADSAPVTTPELVACPRVFGYHNSMSTDLTTSTAETLADLIAQLGDIPPSRILLHPQPGTATEEDVLRLEGAANKRLCELIDGTLVEKAMGFQESLLATYLIRLLSNFVEPRKLGVVLSSDGMMRIIPSQIRIPDVSYISWDRLPGRRIPKVQVPRLAPNLAIEVLSPSNTDKEMDRKRSNYFTGGTLEVWEVLIPTREVVVYFPDGNFNQFSGNSIITTSVLPGMELAIAEMFAKLDETG